jgi:hypothetical protein
MIPSGAKFHLFTVSGIGRKDLNGYSKYIILIYIFPIDARDI